MNEKQVGLTERIRRAKRGERIIIPCTSKQRAHHYMRAVHATALRVGRVVETEAAMIHTEQREFFDQPLASTSALEALT